MAYATLTDVRNEGLTESDASDSRVNALLSEASDTIDELTGQSFSEVTETRTIIGRGSRMLWLPVPVSAVTEVRHVDMATAAETILPASSYYVHARPQDAKNPRIESLGGTWANGATYEVDGTWGRVDADGNTPADITRATVMLVIHWAGGLMDPDANAFRRQADLRSISVRGRSESYGGSPTEGTLTGVPDADRILARYRAPIEVWA